MLRKSAYQVKTIRNARVLRAGFVPREVEHRDVEVNHLSSVLEPITNGEPTDTAIVIRPNSAGKTCILQFVIERLRQEVLNVETTYVNCTGFRTLYQTLDDLGVTINIHRQPTPRGELVDRLQQHDGLRTAVIFDEVDRLEDPSLIYDPHSLAVNDHLHREQGREAVQPRQRLARESAPFERTPVFDLGTAATQVVKSKELKQENGTVQTLISRFTERYVRFAKRVADDTDDPAALNGGGGFADYAMRSPHCLRIYLDTSYRITIDPLKEMPYICREIGLGTADLPHYSTLCLPLRDSK